MSRNDGTMYYLNSTSRRFENLVDSQAIMSPMIDGIFSFKQLINNNVLLYEACNYRRFSLGIAVFSGGKWRLRFRLVPTAKHGLLVFKQCSTLRTKTQLSERIVLPTGNIVLVIGIKSIHETSQPFELHLRVFANEGGNIDIRNFNGIDGSIVWSPGPNKGKFYRCGFRW